ncbi:hypothetical protein BJ166DRAFT_9580 [Pestalotiopsis sp. NC0098]|nr:hypothetical protein BJ166DRAFT_9580 [Pestalotiopsis sp. NC0098]
MPATFQSLPREILRNIFINFCDHYDLNEEALDQAFPTLSDPLNQHTLFSLCLVARSFQDVAQVLLYRRFLSRDGKKEPNDQANIIVERLNSQLGSFLRTVTERPDLAALVKGVTCNAYYASLAPVQASTHPWKTIAFIVNKLPNLEQYSVDFLGALPFYFRQIEASRGRTSIDVFEYFFNLLKCSDIEEAVQVTGVPTLNLRMSDSAFRCFGTEQSTSTKLRISTLRIVDSRIHRVMLDAILSRCTDLKTFTYKAHKLDGNSLSQLGPDFPINALPADQPQFDQLDASESLAVHKDTLMTLHLDMRQKVFGRQPRAGSSLASFTALQSLLVDSFFVCSKRDDRSASPQWLVEMLPPNLVSLELVGCPGKALPVFAKMFVALIDAIRKGRFQALKHIDYSASSVSILGADTCFDDLAVAEKFAELGVAFTYNRLPFDDSELATAGDRAWDLGVIPFGIVDFVDFSRCCHYQPHLGSALPLPDEDEDDDL